MTLTYIDSGVLITASRGENAIAEKALTVLSDETRTFASSEFVKLEVLPKAIYNKQLAEAAFYEVFFNSVTGWATNLNDAIHNAYQIALDYGIAAMDALHVAAALQIGAAEIITTERPSKPIHRVTLIHVISV